MNNYRLKRINDEIEAMEVEVDELITANWEDVPKTKVYCQKASNFSNSVKQLNWRLKRLQEIYENGTDKDKEMCLKAKDGLVELLGLYLYWFGELSRITVCYPYNKETVDEDSICELELSIYEATASTRRFIKKLNSFVKELT